MKIIELKLDKEKSGEGITAISLVKNPAIEHNWVAFSEGESKFNPAYAFKTVDEDKRVLAGPAMIPDKLIYRVDPSGEEYFVFFTEDTIRELSEHFLFSGKQGSLTLEHEATLNGISVVESWIVEDPERDKSASYGFSLPKGTWFVTAKVLNDEVWNFVKEKNVAGFSVEGAFTHEIIKQSQQMKTTKLDEYLDKIRGLFAIEEKPEVEAEVKPEEKPVDQEKFGSIQAEGANGSVTITYPGEVLEVGGVITTTIDDTEVPVPTGEYALEDGTVLVVAEDGIVGEVRPAEEEEMDEEKPAEDSGLKEDQINQLVEGIAEILSTFKADMIKGFDDKVEVAAEALRKEFNSEAEKFKKEIPSDEQNDRRKIVKGLNKFVKDSK